VTKLIATMATLISTLITHTARWRELESSVLYDMRCIWAVYSSQPHAL